MASEWYVQVMGEVIGPMSSSQLREEARQGRITRDALVRKGDDGDWILVDRIKGLFDSTGQPVQSKRPDAGKRDPAGRQVPRKNGRSRRAAPVDEEDDAEEAELVVEDERPPWFKKRYIFSTSVVFLVAAWLGYSYFSARHEKQTIQESYEAVEPVEFETLQEAMQHHELRLRSLGATSKGLLERLVSTFAISNPAILQTPAGEIEEFRQYLEKSELELVSRYTEGVSGSLALEILGEYFDLIREMELERDSLEELKYNNPSEYKIKMFIDSLKRVENATISNCIALHKLARNQESRATPGEG